MHRSLIILAVLLGAVLLTQGQATGTAADSAADSAAASTADSAADSAATDSSSDSGSAGGDGEEEECCLPDQWEGREMLRTVSTFWGDYVALSISNVSFDFTGQRQVYESVKFTNKGVGEYRTKVIWLANEGIFYTINLSTGNCVARRSLDTLVKRCTSEEFNFKVVDEGNYGMGDNALPVSRMTYKIPGMYDPVYGTTTMTKDCVPVVDQKLTISLRGLSLKVKEYVDVTEGIKSEDVFAIPEQCPTNSDDDDDDDKRRSAEDDDIFGTPGYF